MTIKEYIENIVNMNLLINLDGTIKYFICPKQVNLLDEVNASYIGNESYVEINIINKLDADYNFVKFKILFDKETSKPLFDETINHLINLKIKN